MLVISLCVQYLDENKQLILAILDNQNLGKLNECATYASNLPPHFFLLFELLQIYIRTLEITGYGKGWFVVYSHFTCFQSEVFLSAI